MCVCIERCHLQPFIEFLSPASFSNLSSTTFLLVTVTVITIGLPV